MVSKRFLNHQKTLQQLGKGILSGAAGAGFVYGLLVASAACMGAGHGSYIIFEMLAAPFNLGPFIWPLLFVMAAFAQNGKFRIAGPLVLLSHYLVAGFVAM